MKIDLRILIPLLLLVLLYVISCSYSLIKVRRVKYLPRWFWAIICFVSIPIGGIVYFIIGRDNQEELNEYDD